MEKQSVAQGVDAIRLTVHMCDDGTCKNTIVPQVWMSYSSSLFKPALQYQ